MFYSKLKNPVDLWVREVLCFLVMQILMAQSGTEAADDSKMAASGHGKVVVCYVGTWATYRAGEGAFDLQGHFDPALCTHLVYAFAGLNNDTNTIQSMDPYLDLEEDYGKGWYSKATALRNKYPHLKVLVAIGGWNEGSAKYSQMVATDDSRKVFVQSVLEFVRKHNFDGLDFDWEFPTDRGGVPEDRKLFTVLMQELRQAFKPFELLLTAAVSASTTLAAAAYELPELAAVLDHFHVMCYDYHGAWDQLTNHNAPLHGSSHDVTESIDYFLSAGVPANKLVLGVPFYGRTFLLKHANTHEHVHANTHEHVHANTHEHVHEKNNGSAQSHNGLGLPANPTGFQGPFTKEDGFLGYNEICRELDSNPGWEKFWDDEGQVPFIRDSDKWVTYDDPLSIQRKVEFGVERGLKGFMVWSVDTDDFLGNCGLKYPLLRALNQALANSTKAMGGSTAATGGLQGHVVMATTFVAISAGWALR